MSDAGKVDGGSHTESNADSGSWTSAACDRHFAATDSSSEAAAALLPFMTSSAHPPCPGIGCDSTVAIPWCGPFGTVAGGVDWVGGFFASPDRSVIKLAAWSGELYFAAPEVSEPRAVPLVRVVGHVLIPMRIGPFDTRAQGLGMRSDSGVAEPPTRCFTEFADTDELLVMPPNWRFYWRPIAYPGWAYCGPISP
jgi:hypothetical protein